MGSSMTQQQHRRRRKRNSLLLDFCTYKGFLLVCGLLHYLVWVVTLVVCSTDGKSSNIQLFFPLDVYAWSVGQTLYTLGILSPLADLLTRKAWESLEQRSHKNVTHNEFLPPLAIPTLNVQEVLDNPDPAQAALDYLTKTYGNSWRETPLLLKGLWTVDELTHTERKLSPEGLLEMHHLTIPYFSDATIVGALEPDAEASVAEIVSGMLHKQNPHKIGSQLVVQDLPELMQEVAPLGFLRDLLGNHFSQDFLMGNPHRRGIWNYLPGTTTVPLFVANTSPIIANEEKEKQPPRAEGECTNDDESNTVLSCPNTAAAAAKNATAKPFTGLHCEPIANVAVQLWGSRTWTLVDPAHSWKLKPSISKDGRSFYPTRITPEELASRIPRYQVTTTPGDAVWLPTWTYHKVDYVYHSESDSNDSNDNTHSNIQLLHQHQLSIGASLFHFRPVDYVRRNPLFAVLLIPSLLKELAGISTQ